MGFESSPQSSRENRFDQEPIHRFERYDDQSLKAEVLLDKNHYGEGFPQGEIDGDTRPGFAFYYKEGKGVPEDGFITADMTDKPELVAVTQEQFDNWSKQNIIAKPVKFIWAADRKTWTVE